MRLSLCLVLPVVVAGIGLNALAQDAGAVKETTETEKTVIKVKRAEYLTVDDARLFLMLRGCRDAPVVLWLHGGPGGAERPLFRYYNGSLESHFLVAYWDQRGAGRSFDPEADPGALSVKQHIADLDRVVEYLRQQFDRDKIVLLGHSWGGALGILYSRDHPDKVNAMVAVAPLISGRRSQQIQHEFVRKEALRRNDEKALSRLDVVGPPPYQSASDMLDVEAIADRYGAVYHTRPNRAWVVLSGMLRGLVTPWELPDLIRGNNVSLAAMHEEIYELDLFNEVQRLDVPVYFLLGRHDRHVDARLAEAWLEQVQAPKKRLTWFERSAHNPPFEEPGRFNARIVQLLDPGQTGS